MDSMMKSHSEYTDMVLKILQNQAQEAAKPVPVPQTVSVSMPATEPVKRTAYLPGLEKTTYLPESKPESGRGPVYLPEVPATLGGRTQYLPEPTFSGKKPQQDPFAFSPIGHSYLSPEPQKSKKEQVHEIPVAENVFSEYLPPTPRPAPAFSLGMASSYMPQRYPERLPEPPTYDYSYRPPEMIYPGPNYAETMGSQLFRASVEDWQHAYATNKVPCPELLKFIAAALDYLASTGKLHHSDRVIHIMYDKYEVHRIRKVIRILNIQQLGAMYKQEAKSIYDRLMHVRYMIKDSQIAEFVENTSKLLQQALTTY